MNEILFFTQILFVLVFLLGALRLSKEALIGFIALQTILANLFVVKQMVLFNMEVTCSDVYMIGSILGMNLLQEYHGKELAKKTMWISMLAMVFFMIVGKLHVSYLPSLSDTTQASFVTVLSQTPRIFLASVATFFIVQRFDMLFFGFLKKSFQEKYLPFRLFCSLVISQLLDTVLFSFLGLYGIVSSMLDIILVSFCIKMLVIIFMTPFTKLSKRFVL